MATTQECLFPGEQSGKGDADPPGCLALFISPVYPLTFSNLVMGYLNPEFVL